MSIEIKTIHYGFGRTYLKSWGIKQALREIYQNFIDFGEYQDRGIDHTKIKGLCKVKIVNNYQPQSLEFLKIGSSYKQNEEESLGKHGEGLKMAFLIFLREELSIRIFTDKYVIWPVFLQGDEIGEYFAIKYKEHGLPNQLFHISFECKTLDFVEFKQGILSPDQVLYTDRFHGSLVDSNQGNIFSKGLFVCNLEEYGYAYDIPPNLMPLDRDREVPREFDVNYHSAKILEGYKKWNTRDLTYKDTKYITEVPNEIKEKVTPTIVGSEIEFIAEHEDGTKEVIKNDSIKQSFLQDNFFSNIVGKLREMLFKGLGLYDMLIRFQEKHIHSEEAKRDFAIILNRAKGE